MVTKAKCIELGTDFWMELEHMAQKGELPGRVADNLKSIISAALTHTIPSLAQPVEIQEMKEFVSEGIVLLKGSHKEKWYDVMVYVPDDTEKGRTFFLLVPKYPDGELKRLKEL